jgi:RHS repeat-associated protein
VAVSEPAQLAQDGRVVAAGGEGRSVVVSWPGALPAPTLEGDTARYAEVAPGVDVTVQARRSGFEQLTVLKTRAAVDAAVAAGGGVASWDLVVKTKGLTAKATQAGGVEFVDAKGVVVSSVAPMVAWDGEVDEASGERVNVAPVKVSVADRGKGRAVLTLTPDQEWLADPDRVFPMSIDPVYASGSLSASYDTDVNSYEPTMNFGATSELRVGTWDGGVHKYRAYVKFPTTAIAGLQVMSASLSIYETWSWSCTARTITAKDAGNVSSSTTWNAQPAIGITAGSLNTAKGFSSSCPSARVSIPVTPAVQAWAAGTGKAGAGTGVLQLSASETDNYAWKRFRSSETTTPPVISYTYNRKPGAASVPSIGGGFTYTPPGGTQAVYTASTTPLLSTIATDPDGDRYRVSFQVMASTSSTTVLSSCTTGWTASGATASCTPATALTNNTQYVVRAAVQDEPGLWNGTWSPWRTIRIAASTPPAPIVTCPDPFSDGSWAETLPTSPVVCTVTAAGTGFSAPSQVTVRDHGSQILSAAITPSNDPAVSKATFQVPLTAGAHALTATATSPTAKTSPQASYSLAFSSPVMSRPVAGASSTGTVPVEAVLPKQSGSVQARLQWRLAGGPASGVWTSDASALTVKSSDATSTTWVGSWDLAAVSGDEVPTRVPVTFEARVCVSAVADPQTCLHATKPSHVVRLPNAFGGSYPVDGSGEAGQVAMFTGEFATAATDVAVQGLGVSRSYASFDGDGALADTVRGVFGPGWTADLGTISGLSGWRVDDTTYADGRIALTDPASGTVYTFAHPQGRTYARPSSEPVEYEPGDTGTEDAALTAVLKNVEASVSPSLVVFEVTDQDGTATTWTPTQPLPAAATQAVTWRPLSVTENTDEPVSAQARTIYYPHSSLPGKVGMIVSVPAGKSPSDCPAIGAWSVTTAKGCVALIIAYGADGTSAPDAAKQVKSITARLYVPPTPTGVTPAAGGPAAGAIGEVAVAAYEYDSAGRLVKATDSRTGLVIRYAWHGASTQLAVITEPGLAPYRLWYQSGAGNQKLSMITRDSATAGSWNPATLSAPPAGSSALARYAYNVTPAGNGTALPDLSPTATAAWQQDPDSAPTIGFGVFGPDYAWDGTAVFTAPAASSTGWQYADLSYTLADGTVVNTASFGAGGWLNDATFYRANGDLERTLDPAAIDTIRASSELEPPEQARAMSTHTEYDTAGNVIAETGPARDVVVDGELLQGVRTRTVYGYDEGAPNDGVDPDTGEPYGLLTSTTVYARTSGSTDIGPLAQTATGYEPLVAGDDSGWTTGLATTTTQRFGPAPDSGQDITRAVRYDAQGRVIEQRQPSATGSTHAGTRRTSYYSTGAQSGADQPCGGKPEWDGHVCRTYYGGAPSAGPELPVTWYTYDMWGQVSTATETTSSGTELRRTTISTDTAGRQVATAITSTVVGSSSRPAKTVTYDAAKGTQATVSGGSEGTITQVTDGWGRPVTYTNTFGETTTTTYTASGQVATITDPTGTQTYTWDGPDASGKTERRGLPTKLTVTRGGTAGGVLTYAARYDALARLVEQTMPGATRQHATFNATGDLTELAYTGQVTPVTETVDPDTGETTWTPGQPAQNQPWLTWSRAYDGLGRTTNEWNGAGTAFDGVPGVSDPAQIGAPSAGAALAADKQYTYDHAGRLTDVNDRTATTTGTVLDPTTPATPGVPCQIRSYTFDRNGNRTSQTSATSQAGDCANHGTPASQAYQYDTADRPTTGANSHGAYTYDALGRQTLIPSVDAPNPVKGDITLAYYHDDLARTITQDGATTTLTLDTAGRRTTSTTGATSQTRHYTNDSDNPAWIHDHTGAITRNTPSLTAGLGATITGTGDAHLAVANPHGDHVTTIPIPTLETTPATTISTWTDYTEYGTPKNTPPPGTSYGYLGQHQRENSPDFAGLTLMGIRLYNNTRGLFTSADSVYQGGDSAYAYPTDPVANLDLTGASWARATWWAFKNVVPWAIRGVCSFMTIGALLCAAIAGGVASAVGSIVYHKLMFNRWRTGQQVAAAFYEGAFVVAGGKFLRSAKSLIQKYLPRFLNAAASALRKIGLGAWVQTIGHRVTYWAITRL